MRVRATELAELSSPQVGALADASAVLAVPLGATEQHGPHLSLSVDTDIAVALCERLSVARHDVVVAPAVAYGSSGEHAGFPGTLSIGHVALEMLIVELGRSAAQTFEHLLFVSAHGGNAEPVTRAVAQLRAESRDVCLFMPRWQGEPHAGRPETSMLLSLHPERVQMQHAAPGDTRPIEDIWPLLRTRGIRAVSASGVLGDPTGATAAEGETLLGELAEALIRDVDAWLARVSV
ncbi:MAG: mycofactocin precursor peptide peptidase [Pseudonocardiales bacterium]|nr:mycofactocin precursor peptide peptidase [Pseudonocardiales bacterium]